jgi:hypothetical protein
VRLARRNRKKASAPFTGSRSIIPETKKPNPHQRSAAVIPTTHIRCRLKNKKVGCTTLKEDWPGSIYSVESHCIVAGTAVDSKGTVTYTGDTSAHSETRAMYTPALGGVSETTMIMDQKYVGSCPAGAQPGDLTNADGRVTHLWKH